MAIDFLSVAYGGGRNGAMLLGMYEHGIRPDVITFANTGRIDRTLGEKPETYEAVDRMSRWCQDHFDCPVVNVHKDSMYASLYDNCMEKKMLPSAAYGFRSCSDKWKIAPQEKFLNHYGPAIEVWETCVHCGRKLEFHFNWTLKLSQQVWKCGEGYGTTFQGHKVTRAIGYDAGESRRGSNLTEDAKYKYWFPLIEWGWFLEDCKAAYVRHGLPIPPKSACFYCPSSTKAEVLALAQDHPDLFAQAVAMERNAAPNLKTVKGLGRHWKWEELVQISNQQMSLLPEAPQMACACFDSEE